MGDRDLYLDPSPPSLNMSMIFLYSLLLGWIVISISYWTMVLRALSSSSGSGAPNLSGEMDLDLSGLSREMDLELKSSSECMLPL